MPTIIVKQGNAVDRPKLKLGELGYSVDTEELHIGGKTANVEILTQNSPNDSSMLATTTKNGFMNKGDKSKLDSIATGANKYIHPDTHPATMITQDSTHRFVTDTEKTTWNNKANASHGNHVPATQSANNSVFLRNDNTWQPVTPENIGATKLTASYEHISGSDNTNYSKIMTATITGSYSNINETFIVHGRSNRAAIVSIASTANNDKKAGTVKLDVTPLNIESKYLASIFRAITIAVDANTDKVELWVAVPSWDVLKIYPQASSRRSYSVVYYNSSNNTAFPTGTSFVNSRLVDLHPTEHPASMIKFTDGKNFQQKLDDGSLRGPQGAQGPQGIQGPKGDTGATGPSGATGHSWLPAVDTSGNLSWTKSSSTTTPTTRNIRGPQGATGAKGATGATGAQGPAGPNTLSTSTTTSGFTNGHFIYNNNGKVGAKALTPAVIGAAAASHTHTKSQISDFPSSLPANGGNADTVDGKHANAFAQLATRNVYTKEQIVTSWGALSADSGGRVVVGANMYTDGSLRAINNHDSGATGIGMDLFNAKLYFYRQNGKVTAGGAISPTIIDVIGEINNLKSSVSSGKNAIASAITAKGVAASGSDSHATLANKISQINVGPSAGGYYNIGKKMIDNIFTAQSNASGYAWKFVPKMMAGLTKLFPRLLASDAGNENNSSHPGHTISANAGDYFYIRVSFTDDKIGFETKSGSFSTIGYDESEEYDRMLVRCDSSGQFRAWMSRGSYAARVKVYGHDFTALRNF